MAFVPGYKHDIFISYAREDNQPHSGIAQGWVSTLVKDLQEMLALKLGSNEFSLWIEDEFGYQGINYLPNEERLRHKIAELQEQWGLFSKRLSRLERARIQETRVDEKMRLEDQINDTRAEREQVEQELSSLENQLTQEAGNEADAVEAGTDDSDIPGRKPVDLPQGYIRCQYDLALEAHKPILQWRAPELNVDEIQDAKHRDFLQFHTVRGDIGIEGLKAEIVKKTKNLKEQASAPDETDSTRGKLVFIDADVSDSPLCDRIRRLLDEEEQIEYIQFEDLAHQESSVREAFEGWIVDCDALMVMYGQVDFSWLNQVFRNVRRIVWNREHPLSAYVVCEPSPEQKQLLRMKIRGLRTLEYGSCSDEQKLREFINSL